MKKNVSCVIPVSSELKDLSTSLKQSPLQKKPSQVQKMPSVSVVEQPNMQEEYVSLRTKVDNSDNYSSVSFNTGVLNDQFDNMDSIS